MSGPARVLVEDPPQRRRDPETLSDRSDWVTKRGRSRLGSPYHLGAGKTNPIRVNAVLRTKACQTKPICPIGRSRRRPARSAVEPSLGPDVQTKPICRHGQEWSRVGEGVCGAVARAAAPNEPNSPRNGREALPTVGAIAPNKANCTRAGTHGRGPATPPVPVLPGQSVQNKANPAREGRRVNALWNESYDDLDAQQTSPKQSQFPPGQQWAGTGEVGGGAVVGAGCTNEANLPRRGRERHCQRWARSRQTKPIGRGVSSMKCQVNRVRRRVLGISHFQLPTSHSRRAKRSQFPGSGRRGGFGVRPRMPVAPQEGPGDVFFLPASQQMDIIRPRMTTRRRPEPPQDRESIRLEVWP